MSGMAERVDQELDPSVLWDAVARWQALVRSRRAQFERLQRDRPDPQDYWRRRGPNFFEAVRARRDPGEFVRAVLAACEEAEAHDAVWATGAEPPPATVLDVGGGFGAVAVPLASRGRRVTVVEPHPTMVALLERWSAEAGVEARVATIREAWPDAAERAGIHDVVVCSHVLYPIEDVVPFLQALVAASRFACLVTLRMASSEIAPRELFEAFHGEPLVPQPTFTDLCAVLAALDLPFTAATFEAESTWSYADLDEAEEVLAHSLLIAGRPDERAWVREWARSELHEEKGRLVSPWRTTAAGVATIPAPAQARRA
jgi:2-polyprenyl-3-methyl-5-hydroxy-6-metoxy-1,4-benzoquinol methylase